MKLVFENALARAKRSNEISSVLDIKAAASFLVTSAQGLFVISRLNPSKETVDAITQQVEKMFAH